LVAIEYSSCCWIGWMVLEMCDCQVVTTPLFFLREVIDVIDVYVCIHCLKIIPESSDGPTSGKFQHPMETLLGIYIQGLLPLSPLSFHQTTTNPPHASFEKTFKTFKTSNQTSTTHTNHTNTQDVSLPKIVHHRRPNHLLPPTL